MDLYDPIRDERDACGIGFVADANARPSRAIVEVGLEALCRVKHRGAVAADALSGDGAGLLLPLPRHLLAAEPSEADRRGLAMMFCDPSGVEDSKQIVQRACSQEEIGVVSWREVPVDPSVLGDEAKASMPAILQAVLSRRVGVTTTEGEVRAFRARRRIEELARTQRVHCYLPSLSFRTVTYKGLCAADRLAGFYLDLADPAYEAWFALFHQRYSTNTAPSWERAQPMRFVAHNGEINTVRGNAAQMKARQGWLGSHDLCPEDLLSPVLQGSGSDSAMLDEAMELLVRGGRDLTHVVTMLIPPAWEEMVDLDGDMRDFLRFHSCLLEPWDGPAAVVFTDGERVAACLDRNGLRPLRVSVCDDGLVGCASEAGAVPTRGHGEVSRFKIGPGQTFCVDPGSGGVLLDPAIKARLAGRRPYSDWVAEHLLEVSQGDPVSESPSDVGARQVAAGYNREDFTVILRPMATEGHEPTSSMGDDTPQPPLANFARPVYSFLKQRFAQVTNPPIDHLREREVMSISTRLGRRAPLLRESPKACALRDYRSCLLFPSAIAALRAQGAVSIDATFDVASGPQTLRDACVEVSAQASEAVAAGAMYVIVTDEHANSERAAIPSALAAGAVHHRLMSDGLRSLASLVVVTDDAHESHHVACLLTNGVDAVCLRLALDSILDLSQRGRLGGDVGAGEAQQRFFSAVEDGLLKIMSKMGISTLDSYRGAQVIEAVGLGADVIDMCFTGVSSPLGGLSFQDLGEDVIARHRSAWVNKPVLVNTGWIKHRKGGEYHAINPPVVDSLHEAVGLEDASEVAEAHQLQRAVRGDDNAFVRFSELVSSRPPSEPRDLLEFAPTNPIAIEKVEPAPEIARRFSTGAMSHGALSAEAHETLAVALAMIGGAANTGEGGEDPVRFRDDRNSSIKQVASGRFGVTPSYLAFAEEIQIKMAQGSKPGEGGQLPGKKVSVEIARLRHTAPGVALISPPPHHDIYSIEDLAQLVFDLKQANPAACVSVKLVATQGVGTVAAGVVKALADVVHIAGADGGTGASPLSSIKNAGIPWEIGLAEAHQALMSNGLRGRARLRADGGMKTGRDIVIAALLGADEYSFGTMALVAEGCILVRTCHRNTCPVGIATQDPKLRAKYAGTPEMVARYLMHVAGEARSILASLGLTSMEQAVGRTDLLRPRPVSGRAGSLDVTSLLAEPVGEAKSFTGSLELQRPRSSLGDRLFDDAMKALGRDGSGVLHYPISNSDRTVGARLGCALARRPPGPVRGTITARFEGEAGQSFGAFLSDGIDLRLTGEANDYVGKGMAGGRIAIRPPANDAGDPCLAGNTLLYGATGGRLFVAGRVGERFAVRNSGAVAVVEGTGDHACEYMTAGAVVILGPTGRNLGAGMSGGEAYVLDDGSLDARINGQLVAAYTPTPGQLGSLKRVIERHVDATGSPLGQSLLIGWPQSSRRFRRIAPVAQVERLEALFEGTAVAATA